MAFIVQVWGLGCSKRVEKVEQGGRGKVRIKAWARVALVRYKEQRNSNW